MSFLSNSSQSRSEHNSSTRNDPPRPKRIANLAAMATNVLNQREELHTVRYIAQIDLEGWMLRRSKVGSKTNMWVVLDATTLRIFKNKTGLPRYTINVRSTHVNVVPEKRELYTRVSSGNGSGKDRLLRLFISSEDESYKWKHALESAVNSDITDYYSFGRSLGSGAYGDVVEATDVRTDERRAVKMIQKGNNMKTREHLEREIQVMKTISHPNIVQTYQIFDLKKTIYIVMEYVEGGDLFDFVAQHECLTEAQGSQTIRSIFQAVEYLHRNGIVHRDLKPENILCLNETWPLEIKVTDFGFSSFLDPGSDADNTMRTQVGTAYFMAPEIISNKGHGPAVDSWACGVILYTILTGRLPFPGRNTTEYFNNVIKGRPLFPAVLWKGISADAMSLVKGLLNLDPNKRLTSLGALQHRWIASPAVYANEIRRDRSNLHSRRRRLFKARKAIIAVAMANKFKATIPQVVDKVGDGTKTVVRGIEQGVKKTADGVGEGIKKTASGVKKAGENIGDGTKKVAEEIGEGTKKVAEGIAEGTKKVAEGIGTGVKKTVDGVETGARIVGDGVKKTADGIGDGLKKTADGIETGIKKTADGIETGFKKTADGIEIGFKKTADGIETGFKKTADGIETGFKKTADGIETGFKKTADGIETGFKKTADGIETGLKKTADGIEQGLKKTGEGIKKGVEKVKDLVDSSDSEAESTTEAASGSNSTRGSGRRRFVFRRRGHGSHSSAVSGSEPSRQDEIQKQADIPVPAGSQAEKENVQETDRESQAETRVVETKQSSSEYYSATEEHSDTEEGWGREDTLHLSETNDGVITETEGELRAWSTARDGPHRKGIIEDEKGKSAPVKQMSTVSYDSSGPGTSRPNLPPLDGLTMGLSDECMTGGITRDSGHDREGGESDTLRKAAAMLLATNEIEAVDRECRDGEEAEAASLK